MSPVTVTSSYIDTTGGVFYSNLESFYNIVPDNLVKRCDSSMIREAVPPI